MVLTLPLQLVFPASSIVTFYYYNTLGAKEPISPTFLFQSRAALAQINFEAFNGNSIW
jgi:hypothetical protein